MTEKQLQEQLDGLFSGLGPLDPDWDTPDDASSGEPAFKPVSTEEILTPNNLVTFRLERQIFALPLEPIVQIVEMVTVTPLPRAQGSLEGVINVRGKAVPVINLRSHFDLPKSPRAVDSHIILVRHGDQIVALIVDEVLSVLDLSDGQLTRTTDMIPHELGDLPLLQGLVLGSEETVLLLDLPHIFSHQRELSLAASFLVGEEEE